MPPAQKAGGFVLPKMFVLKKNVS